MKLNSKIKESTTHNSQNFADGLEAEEIKIRSYSECTKQYESIHDRLSHCENVDGAEGKNDEAKEERT